MLEWMLHSVRYIHRMEHVTEVSYRAYSSISCSVFLAMYDRQVFLFVVISIYIGLAY
jgi:hypothetical protein